MTVKHPELRYDIPLVNPRTGVATKEFSQFLKNTWLRTGGGLNLVKGDILVFDGDRLNKLAVGSNTQNLEADSSEPTGIKWG